MAQSPYAGRLRDFILCIQTVMDSRMFTVSPYPVVNAGPDNYICSNVTQYQLNGVGNNYDLLSIHWTVSVGMEC